MRLSPSAVLALLAAVSVGALLAGCGSGTKTVSVAETPSSSQTTSTITQPTGTSSTSSTPQRTTPAQTTTSGGTSGPTSTRTAPEPAFTEKRGSTDGLAAATAVLRAKGFMPVNPPDYHSGQTLRVLVGTPTESGDGYGQQAFFFVNGKFIGTDVKAPSAKVRVVSQADTEVTLAYPLYRKGEPLCCPTGGTAKVRFQLNNGTLTPLDAIPPANSSTGTSRQ